MLKTLPLQVVLESLRMQEFSLQHRTRPTTTQMQQHRLAVQIFAGSGAAGKTGGLQLRERDGGI